MGLFNRKRRTELVYNFRIETADGDFYGEVNASRREIARRDLFTYLLSLVNYADPARPRFQFVGVHDFNSPLPKSKARTITKQRDSESWYAGRAVWARIGLGGFYDAERARQREAAN